MKDEIAGYLTNEQDLQGLLTKKEHHNQKQIKQNDSHIKQLLEDKNNQINRLNIDNRHLQEVISKM